MSATVIVQLEVSFALLAGCAGLAWKRGRTVDDPPRRVIRLLLTAAVPVLAAILLVAIGTRRWDGEAVGFIAGVLIILLPVGLVAVLAIELVLWRLRPVRSRRWLAAAITLFLALSIAVPLLISLVAALPSSPDESVDVAGPSDDQAAWMALDYLILVAAAALVWWSYLPRGRAPVAALFE